MRAPILSGILLLCACGGSSSSGPTEAPITLTSAGLSSTSITIPSGGRVHFYNKDTVDHQLTASAPACAALSSKRLTPGTDDLRPQMTGPLSCSFSDSLSTNTAFNGSVVVTAPGAGGGGGGGGSGY